MIYIRAWYVQTDPLPPPAGVLPDLVPDDGETYDDSEDCRANVMRTRTTNQSNYQRNNVTLCHL